jgi:hypothetical protein
VSPASALHDVAVPDIENRVRTRRDACIKDRMETCDIRHVDHEGSYRWKWRHVAADGTVKESPQSYSLFYECMVAARESGYEPRLTSSRPA